MASDGNLDILSILELYRRFAADLRAVHERMGRLYRSRCRPWRNRSLLHIAALAATEGSVAGRAWRGR